MPGVISERPTYSPSEKAARIRRCARAIKQGVMVKDLKRLYSEREIEDARKMAGVAG